jgi:hypothetical protein
MIVGAVVGAGVTAFVLRERRWLRRVQRASGDPDALARVMKGRHRYGR